MVAGEIRELRVEHGASLYELVLSSDMYPPPDALWEMVKNGWDACIRKLRSPGCPKGYAPRVSISFVSGHPLSRDGLALVAMDNGEGLTEPSKERFLKVGSDEEDAKTTGVLDQKRIGRIAVFTLLEDRRKGFYCLSATSREGLVQMMHITAKGLARQVIEERSIARDDTHLNGMCPKGSFTIIVIPNVLKSMRDASSMIEDLKWRIPRRPGPNGFILTVDNQVVIAPPLATELCVESSGIVGCFEKDSSDHPEGIRLCDAETGIWVATASKMAERLPFPLARTEITGDLFVPGLARNQNTARSGLSPVFLRSDKWREIQEILFTQFSPKLTKMLGDDGIIKSDPLGRATRQVVFGFRSLWGEPDATVPVPPGLQPPPGFGDEEAGGEEPAGSGGSNPPRKKNKPKTQRTRKEPFNYKGVTYFLGVMKLRKDQVAQFYGPNIIYVNTVDPLLDRFESAPAALHLHVLRGIVAAIERTVDENIADVNVCEMAVNETVALVYEKGSKSR